jgi:hypothetical protein
MSFIALSILDSDRVAKCMDWTLRALRVTDKVPIRFYFKAKAGCKSFRELSADLIDCATNPAFVICPLTECGFMDANASVRYRIIGLAALSQIA